ncbi:hypothetical protein, partial [Rhodoplanes serenus]|uniref:hypothetical protein n=1 Tax=Rhodoplanes serenus TaxID=200615 RepID=UPI001AEE06F5
TIITSPRHQLAILIVANLPSKLSRYTGIGLAASQPARLDLEHIAQGDLTDELWGGDGNGRDL